MDISVKIQSVSPALETGLIMGSSYGASRLVEHVFKDAFLKKSIAGFVAGSIPNLLSLGWKSSTLTPGNPLYEKASNDFKYGLLETGLGIGVTFLLPEYFVASFVINTLLTGGIQLYRDAQEQKLNWQKSAGNSLISMGTSTLISAAFIGASHFLKKPLTWQRTENNSIFSGKQGEPILLKEENIFSEVDLKKIIEFIDNKFENKEKLESAGENVYRIMRQKFPITITNSPDLDLSKLTDIDDDTRGVIRGALNKFIKNSKCFWKPSSNNFEIEVMLLRYELASTKAVGEIGWHTHREWPVVGSVTLQSPKNISTLVLGKKLNSSSYETLLKIENTPNAIVMHPNDNNLSHCIEASPMPENSLVRYRDALVLHIRNDNS